MTTDYQALCGWVNDPVEVAQICATLDRPTIATAAGPDLAGSGEGKSYWFWQAEEKVLGRVLPSWTQAIGDCVSFGNARGVQDLLLLQIATGAREELPIQPANGQIVATEPIYAGSRVEIGRGQIRGDGSVGAWAAKWLTQWGILLRQKYGSIDLTTYAGARAKEWGSAGCPDALEPIAKEHPVKTIALVETYEQARDLLVSGHPVMPCSQMGFAMKRDADGFCRRSGTWGHCTESRGHLVLKGNRPAIAEQNSWGDYLGGTKTVTLESGQEVELPQGCFLIDPDDYAQMLREGDTWAIADAAGFQRKKLNFHLV